jgi:hypothetical protein
MKQTDRPLSEGCVHIMHKKLRNFYFFERIFAINVLNARFFYCHFTLCWSLREFAGLVLGF